MTSASKKIYLDPQWEIKEEIQPSEPAQVKKKPTRKETSKDERQGDLLATTLDEKTGTKPKTRVLSLLPSGATELNFQLDKLVEIAANSSDAYSTLLFLSNDEQKLELVSFQSLSRDLKRVVAEPSLVTWTAESKARISVSIIDRQQHSPGYYESADVDVSSFCAVPIIGITGKLEGVLAIDSKKSYAFNKQVETLLESLSYQAAFLIHLHQLKATSNAEAPLTHVYEERFDTVGTIDGLLTIASDVPQSVIEHRCAVIVANAELLGKTEAKLYGFNEQSVESNKLLNIICKRKKGLSVERTVTVLPTADITSDPFVSLPIKVLGVEAGSINILACSGEEIYASEVVKLERYAKAVGQKLEAIKLKDLSTKVKSNSNLFGTWKQFESDAAEQLCLEERILVLTNIEIETLVEIEKRFGLDVATTIEDKLVSLASQLARESYLLTRGTRNSIYLVCPTDEIDSYVMRLQALLKRALPGTEFNANQEAKLASELASQGLVHRSRQLTSADDLSPILPDALEDSEEEVING